MRSPIGPASSGPRTVTFTGLGVFRGSCTMMGIVIVLGSGAWCMRDLGITGTPRDGAVDPSVLSVRQRTDEPATARRLWLWRGGCQAATAAACGGDVPPEGGKLQEGVLSSPRTIL